MTHALAAQARNLRNAVGRINKEIQISKPNEELHNGRI